MRAVIFSDIHGNLLAFKTMLQDAGRADLYISLGDVVGYGPWSDECVELLEGLDNSIKILGNHEEYFLSGEYTGDNDLAKTFFQICIKKFNNQSLLKSYIKEYQLGKYLLTHTIGSQYIFADSKISLDKNYMIGHSHRQFILDSNGFNLINVGSVGQNREYINVINYVIYDSKDDKIYKKSIPYNVDIFIKEMERKKYPNECLDYYRNKMRIKI